MMTLELEHITFLIKWDESELKRVLNARALETNKNNQNEIIEQASNQVDNNVCKDSGDDGGDQVMLI